MNILQDLTKILHSISVSLQFSMFLPATLLVVGLTWLLYPDALLIPESWLSLSLAVLTLSYLFYSLNRPFMRILEGYAFPKFPIFKELRERRLFEYAQACYRREECDKEIDKINAEIYRLSREKPRTPELELQIENRKSELHCWESLYKKHDDYLINNYPHDPHKILPTEFGHTMVMAEFYSYYHYGIDIITLWPRFIPTLREKGFTPQLEEAKGVLDFLVNLIFVSGGLWISSLLVFAITGRPIGGFLILFLPIITVILYIAACKAARRWGVMMNVACDLYRFTLCADLNLRQKSLNSLEDEKEMWLGISTFLHATQPDNYDGFDYDIPFPNSFAPSSQRGSS